MSVKSSFQSWLTSCPDAAVAKQFVLLDSEDKASSLTLTISGKLANIQTPNSADGVYTLETEEDTLQEYSSAINIWALEKQAEITNLSQFLDKAVQLYYKQFLSSKSSPSPTTADSLESWEEVNEEKSCEDSALEDEETNDFKDDGGDWGEFQEEGEEQQVQQDSEWEQWHSLKKKWLRKEEELRKEGTFINDKKVENIFSVKASSQAVMNTLIDLMKNGQKEGLQVAAVNENMFVWNIKMTQFPAESQLYKDLMRMNSKYNFNEVELEMKIPMDIYPFFPPSVRLVRPRLKNFMIGRIVCMSELDVKNWSAIRTLNDILGSIRRLLSEYGEVDDENEVNNPANSLPPYTNLEFQLLRLAMLTGIQPRVVKTLPDKQQEQFKQHNSTKKSSEKKENSATSPSSTTSSGDTLRNSETGTVWKKGTGYGTGSGTQEEWDPTVIIAAQRKKDNEIQEILEEVLAELKTQTIAKGLAAVLDQSSLIPFLAHYMANDSLTDQEAHLELYHTIYEIAIHMAKHSAIVPLFGPLVGEKTPLLQFINDLYKQAAIVEKFHNSAGSSTINEEQPATKSKGAEGHFKPRIVGNKKKTAELEPIVSRYKQTLTAHIVEMQKAVSDGLATAKAEADKGQVNNINNINTVEKKANNDNNHSNSKDEKQLDFAAEYVKQLTPYKFKEVEKFTYQKYYSQYANEQPTNRAWIKRLATEYSDLSKSLPINPSSSVFMRVLSDKMAFAQMLIFAPDETPYGYGAFVFDVYFPTTYPTGPPLVNLQTTGGGTVRFNPNLYNCGKVCLSLLGTWSGTQGENWSAATSTFLQVAISVQSLIFVPLPYFNEPGYESSQGSSHGKTQSDAYNANIQAKAVQFAMIEQMKKPSPGFEKAIAAHFYLQKDNIMKQCEDWATTNSAVKALLPELKAELAKQKLPTPDEDDE
jgi:baculoviral IAP repeat-containing protein 6